MPMIFNVLSCIVGVVTQTLRDEAHYLLYLGAKNVNYCMPHCLVVLKLMIESK